MLIRKKALDDAGFFDDRYFFFFEEADLADVLRCAGWSIYQVLDAFIYYLPGQSIGHSVGSRIEFYCSRYQFLRKWHSPLYYYLAGSVVFLRLLINWMFSFVAVAMTLGLAKKLTQKLAVYS